MDFTLETELDSDEEMITIEHSDQEDNKQPMIRKKTQPIIGDCLITKYLLVSSKKYHFKDWNQCFPNHKVKLRSLVFNPAWNEFFDLVQSKSYFREIEKEFSDYLRNDTGTILPYAELVFNIFNVISPESIKVVIIGQDPYPGVSQVNDRRIPQAMGFSFSVPFHHPKADSLRNIYQNLLFFNHISKIPDSGCLSAWVMQGCFLLNSSLTTFYTQRNVHRRLWKPFTNDLISYLNQKHKKIVYLVWGKDAHQLCQKINPAQNHIITSSHPSPLSVDKTFGGLTYGNLPNPYVSDRNCTYPSFRSMDHFGRANQYLKSINKSEILWDLLDE